MRQDKQFAFELRKQGKSYREIQEEIKISRSTLCNWFKNVEWSKHIKTKNNKKVYALSKERIENLNKKRKEKLDLYYQKTDQEAKKEFEVFKKEPLFMAGLMLYAGEGDKRSRHVTRITNTEFYIHRIFIAFSEKYLGIKRDNIKLSLLLYPDLDIHECIDIWAKELDVDKRNFYRTQIIQGKEKIKRLQYGVGMSIIASRVRIKMIILSWLECAKIEYS